MHHSGTRISLLVVKVALLLLTLPLSAHAVNIRTVPVGDAGNAPDPLNGYGAVKYDYRIGATEVTNAEYMEFLNAVAATDTYGLYRSMAANPLVGITRTGLPGSYVYSIKSDVGSASYANKPVVFVGWGDAARFSNWLHNGQPRGPQNASTTEDGAYTLNGATTVDALSAVVRNPDATWFIPSEDEWYKAAYYDADMSNYYLYPTGSDLEPDDYLPSSDSGNSANFRANGSTTGNGIHRLTDVGAYTQSASPYGTFDQGGNVMEWNEALGGRLLRGLRGGAWPSYADDLAAESRTFKYATEEGSIIGFRVATIPEPSAAVLAISGGAMALTLRRRFSQR